MSTHESIKGERRPKRPEDVLLPVTRLVSQLSMTIQNGQLVARPALLQAA